MKKKKVVIITRRKPTSQQTSKPLPKPKTLSAEAEAVLVPETQQDVFVEGQTVEETGNVAQSIAVDKTSEGVLPKQEGNNEIDANGSAATDAETAVEETDRTQDATDAGTHNAEEQVSQPAEEAVSSDTLEEASADTTEEARDALQDAPQTQSVASEPETVHETKAQALQEESAVSQTPSATEKSNTSAVEEATPATTAAVAQKTAGEGTLPNALNGTSRGFSEKMAEAGYITGRRYDAVKNAFLSYVTATKKPRAVASRINRSGETFGIGKKILGRLRIVGGYLRLFLPLDPKQFNADKYHHRDMSEVARYAKYPLMIKLSSDRQTKYAEELIDAVMSQNGLVKNPDYREKDQADIFKKSRTKKVAASVAPQQQEVAVVALPDEKPSKDVNFDNSENVKLPRNAYVVDKSGYRVGKVRKSVWKDNDDNFVGKFVKQGKAVFVSDSERHFAYLDKQNNVLSMQNAYVATLKRRPSLALWAILLALLFLMTSVLCVFVIVKSVSDYVPTLFIASKDGTSWQETENLPIFYQKQFGDTTVVPGATGKYRFVFQNKNADALEFSLAFSETNQYGINMLYRLKRDGAYISDENNFVTAEQLSQQNLTIEANSSTTFELEWQWQHNDATDTVAGENSATYSLHIAFTAWVKR